jgi:hypothetical protein
MRPVLICFILFFLPLHPVCAQNAKYSRAIMSEEMYIVGAVGNTIHAWSTSKISRKIFKEFTLLTLYIYSPGMDLIEEKKISLGESEVTKIDFQMENSFYYLNIIYISRSRVNKKLMYKIDAAGNLTDVTDIPGLFTKPHYSSGSPSAAVNSSTIFAGKISASVADSSIVNASLPPGENFDNKQSYEKLAVRKISIDKRQVAGEKVYASGYLNFSRLMITATDSTVYACAFAQSKTGINKNPYKGSYLFLARLDTSLVEPPYGTILLQNEKWPDNVLFIPNAIFSLNNRLLILSTGLYSKTNFAYNLDGRTDVTSGAPQVITSYVPGSIMITQMDENNRLLADTIIKIKEGREQLEWGNRFILPASNEVQLFCTHQYTSSIAGISLFTIGQNGKINERDLIVDENYSYILRLAVSLEPGVLLVPYTYKRKTGLMKLAYGTTE